MSEPRRMVPRYPDPEDAVSDARSGGDPELAVTDVPTHVRVLEKVRAAYADRPPHILRHEETKDGLDKLIQIIDSDRHPPPFDFELPKMTYPQATPSLAVIDEAELAKLRQDAADARVLRGELERITAELHQLRTTHDKLLITHEKELIQHRFTKGDLETARTRGDRADRALIAILNKEVPAGHQVAYGLNGVIDYLTEIAAYGLGHKDTKVNLDEEDE